MGNIISVSSADAEMEAAMQKARDTFPEFWEQVSEEYQRVIPAFSLIMVKGYFFEENDPESGEHMWVDEIRFDGQFVTGVLSSDPGKELAIARGDTVEFPLSRVSDWLIVDGSDMARGAFTVQLLRSRMSAEERAEHDSHYNFSFPQ